MTTTTTTTVEPAVPLPRLLYPREVAVLFSVDPKTVTRWAIERRIPGFQSPGGHWRFREDEMRAIRDGGRTDLDTLINRARKVADKVTFDFHTADGDEPGVTALVWKGDVCEYATAATPTESLSAAVDKLAAYLAGGVS